MCRSQKDPDGPRSCSSHCRTPYAVAHAKAAELDARIASLQNEIDSRTPSLDDLEAAGYAAAMQGRPAAPALDEMVQRALDGAPIGDPNNVAAMKAFSRGYEARRDDELAEAMGAQDAADQKPLAPHSHPKMREAIAGSDALTGQSLAKRHAQAYKERSLSGPLMKHRDSQAQEAEHLAMTRGPRGGTPAAAEALAAAHRDAVAGSADATSVWRSEGFLNARREYGPGSANYRDPIVVGDPSTASDRDLRNAENDLFYASEHDPHQSSEAREGLAAIRAEMSSRGLGPKAL